MGARRPSSRKHVPRALTTKRLGRPLLTFYQEAKGQYGWGLMEAAFRSESATHRFAPEYVPRPVKLGTYESDPNTHFFLADFVEMLEDEIPEPEPYMAAVMALHQRSMGQSPEGKFGFAVNTRFGDLEQSNRWDSSWEGFWTGQMRDFISREERLRGPHDAQLVRLRDLFLERVLPRYLRPLETEGRSITPCLIHADLWPGNVKYRTDGTTVCMYDASALWGHNEGMPRILFSNLPRSVSHSMALLADTCRI